MFWWNWLIIAAVIIFVCYGAYCSRREFGAWWESTVFAAIFKRNGREKKP